MNKEKIIEIAKECGLVKEYLGKNLYLMSSANRLEAFAQEIRNRTIDECAGLCSKYTLAINPILEIKHAIRNLKSEVTE